MSRRALIVNLAVIASRRRGRRWKLAAVAALAIAAISGGAALAADAPLLLGDALDLPSGTKLSGSVRIREEAIGNQIRTGLRSNDSVMEVRTTLFGETAIGPLRIGGEIYDSRAFGAGSPLTANEVDVLEPVQAYVAADLTAPFGPGSRASIQAGRFTMNLGSRRLVVVEDYRNTTNGFTGLRADLALPSSANVTVFVVEPQLRLPNDPTSVRDSRFHLDRDHSGQVLWGLFASRREPRLAGAIDVAYVGLNEHDRPGFPTRDRNINTFSARVLSDPGPRRFDYEAELMLQVGTISASAAPGAAPQKVHADFAHLRAGYQFADPWSTHLSVEFDRASGDDAGRRYTRFDTLFGSRRGDLGPAGLYSEVGRANLMTPGIRLELTPRARWDAMATYHRLYLASAVDSFSTTGVRDASGRSGRHAGDQLDLRWRYWLVPASVRLEADYALIAAGRFLKSAPNGPAGNVTSYGSLSVSWQF